MSGVNGTDISSWLQDVREGVDLSYYNVAFMTVLPLYDAVLTSAQELQILWRQRPRPKSICIFYLNRSSQVLLAFAIATNYLYRPYSCKGVATSQTVAFISLYAILAFSGTLRAYALCGQRWYLCITVLVLALVPCFQDIIILAASVIYATETQCIFDIALIKWTGTIEQAIMISARLCVIASDSIVIVVTLWRVLKHGDDPGIRTTFVSRPYMLKEVVMVHGVWYFLSLAVLNIVDIMMYYLCSRWTDVLMPMSVPLCSVLLSRFLLDISESAQRNRLFATTESFELQSILTMSSIEFAGPTVGAHETGQLNEGTTITKGDNNANVYASSRTSPAETFV